MVLQDCTLDFGSTSVGPSFIYSLLCSLNPFLSSLVRDTAGTALYFLEYDGMRHLLGRQRSGEQGPTPSWLPVPASVVPFVCGSVSGVLLHDTIHVCPY